jgi:hypothetical protein
MTFVASDTDLVGWNIISQHTYMVELLGIVRADATCRRLMTVPGVGEGFHSRCGKPSSLLGAIAMAAKSL